MSRTNCLDRIYIKYSRLKHTHTKRRTKKNEFLYTKNRNHRNQTILSLKNICSISTFSIITFNFVSNIRLLLFYFIILLFIKAFIFQRVFVFACVFCLRLSLCGQSTYLHYCCPFFAHFHLFYYITICLCVGMALICIICFGQISRFFFKCWFIL